MTIDRIEGASAVCETEDGSFITLPLSALPSGAQAGDILTKSNDGWKIDEDARALRESEISGLEDELFI